MSYKEDSQRDFPENGNIYKSLSRSPSLDHSTKKKKMYRGPHVFQALQLKQKTGFCLCDLGHKVQGGQILERNKQVVI